MKVHKRLPSKLCISVDIYVYVLTILMHIHMYICMYMYVCMCFVCKLGKHFSSFFFEPFLYARELQLQLQLKQQESSK